MKITNSTPTGNNYFFILIIGIFSFIFISCSKPIIKGKVVDYYNHPISDVVVSVQGTQFNSVTGSDGEYSIGFVPGKVQLKYAKGGFAEANKSFDISASSTFPAEQTQLLKLPSSTGVWFMGDNDYVDISVGRMQESSFQVSNMEFFPGKHYNVSISGNFTAIPYQANYKFLISSSDKILLVKIRENDLVYNNISDFGLGMYKEEYKILRENKNEEISPTVSLRTVSLERGKYAYVGFLDTPEDAFKSSSPFRGKFRLNAYCFEIK
jgi:hypothetical protein